MATGQVEVVVVVINLGATGLCQDVIRKYKVSGRLNQAIHSAQSLGHNISGKVTPTSINWATHHYAGTRNISDSPSCQKTRPKSNCVRL